MTREVNFPGPSMLNSMDRRGFIKGVSSMIGAFGGGLAGFAGPKILPEPISMSQNRTNRSGFGSVPSKPETSFDYRDGLRLIAAPAGTYAGFHLTNDIMQGIDNNQDLKLLFASLEEAAKSKDWVDDSKQLGRLSFDEILNSLIENHQIIESDKRDLRSNFATTINKVFHILALRGAVDKMQNIFDSNFLSHYIRESTITEALSLAKLAYVISETRIGRYHMGDEQITLTIGSDEIGNENLHGEYIVLDPDNVDFSFYREATSRPMTTTEAQIPENAPGVFANSDGIERTIEVLESLAKADGIRSGRPAA